MQTCNKEGQQQAQLNILKEGSREEASHQVGVELQNKKHIAITYRENIILKLVSMR